MNTKKNLYDFILALNNHLLTSNPMKHFCLSFCHPNYVFFYRNRFFPSLCLKWKKILKMQPGESLRTQSASLKSDWLYTFYWLHSLMYWLNKTVSLIEVHHKYNLHGSVGSSIPSILFHQFFLSNINNFKKSIVKHSVFKCYTQGLQKRFTI